MPSRIIRDGWLESEAIDQLSSDAECFFLRLSLRADDFGRYSANVQLLKSNLFPLKPDIRITDISRWIAACVKAGLIRCYEIGGKQFMVIPKFNQRTRAEKSKFPDPPEVCQTDVGQAPDRRPSPAHVVEVEVEDVCEVDSRVKEDPEDGSFNQFWAAYPRKVKKQEAMKAFSKISKKEELLERILKAIEQQKQTPQWVKQNGEFIPHPSSWLNGRRWEDEVQGMEESCGPIRA